MYIYLFIYSRDNKDIESKLLNGLRFQDNIFAIPLCRNWYF